MGLIDHLKHRLNPKTIAAEAFATLTDKVIPQGSDEVGNVLFSGNAYLPWPGPGHTPALPAPEVEPAVEPPDLNSHQEHASIYGVSYTEQLNQSAQRGGNDRRGMSR